MSQPVRKVVIREFGDVSNVSVVDGEIADPGSDEVQVKIIYSGFNGADINMRRGTYPMQKSAPLTPGYCLVGRVESNGQNCSKFKRGDLVAALTIYDSEATLSNVPEKYLHPIPAGADLQHACAFVLDWATAYGMVMHTADVKKGSRVFIHGMSGAVGYAAMSLCHAQGAHVYGTASQRNHAAIRELGATPFVYSNKDWMDEMKKIGGANVVLDPLGFESFDESFSILSSEDGLLIGYGGNLTSLNGEESRSVLGPVLKMLGRNANLFSNKKTRFYYITRDQKNYPGDLQALFKLEAEGKIQPLIKHVWGLEEIQDAHRAWTTTQGMGSVLVKISD